MPAGRPQIYDKKAVLEKLCTFMASGCRNMNQICEEEADIASRTEIYEWCANDSLLADILMQAQRLWALAQADKIFEIVDDESRDVLEIDVSYQKNNGEVVTKTERRSDNTAVNRDKLRVGARQWAMAKLIPKVFGDKVQQEITGKDGKDLIPELNVVIEKK